MIGEHQVCFTWYNVTWLEIITLYVTTRGLALLCRSHADEATAKSVGGSYQVQMDVGQASSWEGLIKHLQSLAEQEARFIDEIKYVNYVLYECMIML